MSARISGDLQVGVNPSTVQSVTHAHQASHVVGRDHPVKRFHPFVPSVRLLDHLEVHEGGVDPTAVGFCLVLTHCNAQHVRLVALHRVHQRAVPSIPETSLAPAVPRDDGHVGGESDAPDNGLLVPLSPPCGHPSRGVASGGVPHSDGVSAACGKVEPVHMPGKAKDPTFLTIQHLQILQTLASQGEQADKPEVW